MQALFSPESKFMRLMGRVADLMILNLLFLCTCLPVVTVGAACTALYHVCFCFGTVREGGIVRTYFRTFCREFRQSTLLWLMLLAVGTAAGLNTAFFYVLPGALRWLFVLFAILFVLLLLTAGYVFPLQSQFENGVLATFKNALALSLAHLPRSLLITGFGCFPFLILLFDLYRFFQMGFLWAVIYFALAAYVNSILLKKVFAPYWPKQPDEGPEEEEVL